MYVIVTGASRGLGKAIANLFAAQGHHLFLTSVNDWKLYQAVEDLSTAHPDITIRARPANLRNKEEARGFGNWVLEHCPSIDILVNNAGSFAGANVHDEPEGALEEMIETNLYSAYHLTRTLVPAMIRQKSGHIFNMSSIAALKAYPGGGSYSISKFALHGFSVNLRNELRPHGIKVTTVFPGATYTDSWASSGLPRDRFMEADDVAKMILAASGLSASACVEDIILRPQLGDI